MNAKKKTLLALALLSLGSTASVWAEEEIIDLDPVIITANRYEEKKSEANADISVVTAKDIEEKHYTSVADAVKDVPGVTLQTRGLADNFTSNKIFINGSSNVVVLVDGVRRNTNGVVGSDSALAAMSMANMDSVERIEVVKGSAATMYGADAVGGVINIITKKPKEDKVETTLTTSFGNNAQRNYNLYNEGKQGNVFWTVEAGHEGSGDYKDGWGRKVISDLSADRYNVKLGYDLGNESDVSLSYSKSNIDYTRPNAGTNDTARDKGKKNMDSLTLQYKAKLSDSVSNLLTLYRNKTSFNDNYNFAGDPENMAGVEWPASNWQMGMKTTGISDQVTYNAGKHNVIGGFDWRKDEVTNYTSIAAVTFRPTVDNVTGKSLIDTSFFVQDKYNFNDQWNVTAGARFSHNSGYGNHTTPSVTVGYKASDKTNYYVSYRQYFVAPTLYHLYSTYGSPDLEAEKGSTYEFGVNHQFDDTLSGAFHVYRRHDTNRIIYSMTEWKYVNTGSLNTTGFDISLDKKLSEKWSTSLGYTYLHIDKVAANENINLNGQLPVSTINWSTTYRNKKWDATLVGKGIMDRYGAKTSPEMRKFGNFWVWDLAANYNANDQLTVFAKLNNIFDQFYTDIGTSTDPQGTGWYSAPGRNFQVGMTYKF